jgi:hypothetical protein
MATTTEQRDDRATKWIRWIARGVGSLAAGFWLFVGLIHVIAAVTAVAEREPWTWESTVLAGLIVASALGALIAWWREGIGGTIIVICAIAHSTFATIASGHNKGFAMVITGGPLLVALRALIPGSASWTGFLSYEAQSCLRHGAWKGV